MHNAVTKIFWLPVSRFPYRFLASSLTTGYLVTV